MCFLSMRVIVSSVECICQCGMPVLRGRRLSYADFLITYTTRPSSLTAAYAAISPATVFCDAASELPLDLMYNIWRPQEYGHSTALK